MTPIDPSPEIPNPQLLGESPALEPLQGFIPFEIVLNIDDIDDHTKLMAAGIVLEVNLSSYLAEKLNTGKVRFAKSQYRKSSLVFSAYFPLSSFDGFTAGVDGLAAANWLLAQLSQFVSEEYKDKITKALIVTGLARYVGNESDLDDRPFEDDRLRFSNEIRLGEDNATQPTIESASGTKENDNQRTNKLRPSGRQIGIGPLGIILILLWIVVNIFASLYQRDQINQKLQSIETLIQSLVVEISSIEAPPGQGSAQVVEIHIHVDGNDQLPDFEALSSDEKILTTRIGAMQVIKIRSAED